PAGAALRRHLRQCLAVSHPRRRPAPGAGPTARQPEARRRAVQLQSTRPQRGGLAGRALWRVVRLAHLAATDDGSRLRGTGALLPSRQPAPGTAALAGQCLAQGLISFPPPPATTYRDRGRSAASTSPNAASPSPPASRNRPG